MAEPTLDSFNISTDGEYYNTLSDTLLIITDGEFSGEGQEVGSIIYRHEVALRKMWPIKEELSKERFGV